MGDRERGSRRLRAPNFAESTASVEAVWRLMVAATIIVEILVNVSR